MPVIATRPYCNLADVQGVAGVTDSEYDDTLIEAINSASRMVEEMTGRNFWFNDHSATPYKVSRKSVIGPIALLPFEIITLTEVGVDGVLLDLADLNYDVGGRSIESTVSFGDYPFTGKMELSGTFGFPLAVDDNDDPVLTLPPPTIPSTVRRAAILIAAALSNEWRKERVAPDGSRESLLEVRIPSEVRTLLRQWDIRNRLSTF